MEEFDIVRKQIEMKSLGKALKQFDLFSWFQDYIRRLEDAAKHGKSMKELESFFSASIEQIESNFAKYQLKNLKNKELKEDSEKLRMSIRATLTLFNEIYSNEFETDFDCSGTERNSYILENVAKISCELWEFFFNIFQLQQDIALETYRFIQHSQLCLETFLESNSESYEQFQNLALFHLKNSRKGYEKLAVACNSLQDLDMEIFSSVGFLMSNMSNDCSSKARALKNLKRVTKHLFKEKIELFVCSEEAKCNFLFPFVSYTNLILMLNLMMEVNKRGIQEWPIAAKREPIYNNSTSCLVELYYLLLRVGESGQMKDNVSEFAMDKEMREKFLFSLFKVHEHLKKEFSKYSYGYIALHQQFVGDCTRIINRYEKKSVNLQMTERCAIRNGPFDYSTKSCDEIEDRNINTVRGKSQNCSSKLDFYSEQKYPEDVTAEKSSSMERKKVQRENMQTGGTLGDPNEESVLRSSECMEYESQIDKTDNYVPKEIPKLEISSKTYSLENKGLKATECLRKLYLNRELREETADGFEYENCFHSSSCPDSSKLREDIGKALIKSDKRCSYMQSSSDALNCTQHSDKDIKTLNDALKYFDLSKRFKEVEKSLEDFRRNKKSKEDHESLLKQFDKEFQKLSTKHHPDKIKNRRGSEIEVLEAQKLQSAINATRTVLSFLNKMFLEDIDIDHKYGFYSKLNISELGNEDEVENHVYDVLFKISFLSEIKQLNIIAKIRKFLIEGQNCLKSFVEGKENDFEKHCILAMSYLKKCITGYEKLIAEFEKVEECKEENEGILSELRKMKRDSKSQLEALKELNQFATRSLNNSIQVFRNFRGLDDYFVLPFVRYVNAILMCHAMTKVKRKSIYERFQKYCQNKIESRFPLSSKESESCMEPFHDEDQLFTEAYCLASLYRSNKHTAMEIMEEKATDSEIKEKFIICMKQIAINLEDQFKIDNYKESSTNMMVYQDMEKCLQRMAIFDEKTKELAEGIEDFKKDNKEMKDELYAMRKDNEEMDKEMQEMIRQRQKLFERLQASLKKDLE